MSDFEAPIKTSLTDAVDPTLSAEVTAARELKVKQAALSSATDSVAVVATDLDIRPLSSTTDSVAVTGSLTVSATDLDIRNLAFAADSVTAHLAAGSTVAVTATDLDIRNLANATDSVTAHLAADSTVAISNQVKLDDSTPVRVQGYVSIQNSVEVVGSIDIGHISDPVYLDQDSRIGLVDGTEIIVSNTVQTRALTSATDSVTVAGTVAVSGSDLDIRDLGFATDSVTAHLAAGSTVAVTASDLDIRNLAHATDSVEAHLAAGSTVALTAGSEVSVNNTVQIRALSAGTDSVSVSGTVAVSGTNLDIRDLSSVTDSVTAHLAAGSTVAVTASDLDIRNLSSATDSVAVTGSVSITSDEQALATYGFEEDVVKGASFTVAALISSGKIFKGGLVLVGSAGGCKVKIGAQDGAAYNGIAVVYQQPRVNTPIPLPRFSIAGNGTMQIVVEVTNLDHTTDLHISIQGTEE